MTDAPRRSIPATGRPWEALRAQLEAGKRHDVSWRERRMAL